MLELISKFIIAGHFYIRQNFILFQLTVGLRVSPLDPSSYYISMDFVHTEEGKKEGQFRIINATSFINYQFFALGSAAENWGGE